MDSGLGKSALRVKMGSELATTVYTTQEPEKYQLIRVYQTRTISFEGIWDQQVDKTSLNVSRESRATSVSDSLISCWH